MPQEDSIESNNTRKFNNSATTITAMILNGEESWIDSRNQEYKPTDYKS